MAILIFRLGVRKPCTWRSIYVILLIGQAMAAPSGRAAATIVQYTGPETNDIVTPLPNNLDAMASFSEANEVGELPL